VKIYFSQTEHWEKEYLKKKLVDHELTFIPEPLTLENVQKFKDADVISIFINSLITKELLDQLPNVKLISTRSTGYDHIDIASCKIKNVTICNVPHYGTHTVAEHTFALILALSRNIIKSVNRTKEADFDFKNLMGFDLYNKTLGIVGLGDIGNSVLRIAQGFGMRVVAYSHHPNETMARKLGITYLDLKELFGVSDIVTLHVPYTKETHHMINKKNIKKFKKGSILINTARGALVETEAVIWGLEEGILKGVGLDVLEEETAIKEEREILHNNFLKTSNFKTLFFDHVLMTKENVVITPHNAFNSIEALEFILEVTAQNILDFENQKPQNTL